MGRKQTGNGLAPINVAGAQLLDFSNGSSTTNIPTTVVNEVHNAPIMEQFDINNVVPLNHHVLVLVDMRNTVTEGGIVVSSNFDTNRCFGTVISFDPNIPIAEKMPQSIVDNLKVGCTVQYMPHAPQTIPNVTTDQKYLLVPLNYIIAILK